VVTGLVVDLNADLGEVVGDLALMEVVTSASIACGGHAGDASTMRAAAEAALANGVVVGAHPSYPDREGFGRSELGLPVATVAAQVAGLLELAPVGYVKCHGALYHRANRDLLLAEAILTAVEPLGLRCVLAQPGALLDAARARGWTGVEEGYCDRGYRTDGSLVARHEPGALLESPDDVALQAIRLADRFRSLCLHGDTPGALAMARRVREALGDAGVSLAPFA
jgi:UPF0271 protein